MWLPSSQIAVKVADNSLRDEKTVVSVTCVPLLILRRPKPGHVAGLIKYDDLNFSGILDAVAKSSLQSQNIASSPDVQVNPNDAYDDLLRQDRPVCCLLYWRFDTAIAATSHNKHAGIVSIRNHTSPTGSMSSFKTRQAVRRCALSRQSSHLELDREALALSMLMPSTNAYVPVLSRCVVGRLRSLIIDKCGDVAFIAQSVL